MDLDHYVVSGYVYSVYTRHPIPFEFLFGTQPRYRDFIKLLAGWHSLVSLGYDDLISCIEEGIQLHVNGHYIFCTVDLDVPNNTTIEKDVRVSLYQSGQCNSVVLRAQCPLSPSLICTLFGPHFGNGTALSMCDFVLVHADDTSEQWVAE